MNYEKIIVVASYLTQDKYQSLLMSLSDLKTIFDNSYPDEQEWDKMFPNDEWDEKLPSLTEPCFIVFGCTYIEDDDKRIHHVTLKNPITMLYNHYDHEIYDLSHGQLATELEDTLMELLENYETERYPLGINNENSIGVAVDC